MNTSSIPNQGIYRKCPESPYISTPKGTKGPRGQSAEDSVRYASSEQVLDVDFEDHWERIKNAFSGLEKHELRKIAVLAKYQSLTVHVAFEKEFPVYELPFDFIEFAAIMNCSIGFDCYLP